jgi:cytochrome c biogenesis protein CcdA
MIGQITPLVQVVSRRTWVKAVTGYLAGSLVSAAALGLLVGTCGLVLELNRFHLALWIVGAGTLALCAIWETGNGAWPLPSLHRQTPKWFLSEFGPTWGGFAWGLDLGQGWTTRIEFAGYYGVVAVALLTGSPLFGAVTLGAFGLGRATPVILAGLLTSWREPHRLSTAYMWRSSAIRRINAFALALAAGYFLAE